MSSTSESDGIIINYLTLRQAIGFLGFLWPLVLAAGAMLVFHTGLQDSISAYYYTGVSGIFIGVLWAIGVFLLAYKGYDNEPILKDSRLSRFAGACAVGASLFPTDKEGVDTSPTGYIHFLFVGCFFLITIYFSLALFTKHGNNPTTKKRQRNVGYRVFGWIMVACVLGIIIYYRLPADVVSVIAPYKPVFWLETGAIMSFGAVWLLKGEFILGDESEEKPKAKAYGA